MTYEYHATPYDISASGFYFTDYDDYQQKAATHVNAYGQPVEEYEIQFIDGDNPELFKALSVDQTTLETWFDDFERLEFEGAAKAIYLADDRGENINTIKGKLDDICLYPGTPEQFAEDHLEDTGLIDLIPENLRYYFDYELFARDLVMSGDITGITCMDENFVVWGG